MAFIRKHILVLSGIFTGALTGYLFYHYVGCSTGTCAISSQPLNSTLYGGMMGGLLFSLFQKEKTKETDNKT